MQIAEACDENTIGVAAILGTTYSGHFEDVAGIDAAIRKHAATACVHLQAVLQSFFYVLLLKLSAHTKTPSLVDISAAA